MIVHVKFYQTGLDYGKCPGSVTKKHEGKSYATGSLPAVKRAHVNHHSPGDKQGLYPLPSVYICKVIEVIK